MTNYEKKEKMDAILWRALIDETGVEVRPHLYCAKSIVDTIVLQGQRGLGHSTRG